MTGTHALSPAQQMLIEAALQPGEIVRWSGSEPHSRYRLHRMGRICVCSAWFALAGLLAGILIQRDPNFLQSSVQAALPIILLGVMTLVGGVLLARAVFFPSKTGSDVYAITDRRALVITPGHKDLCRSYPPETLASAWVRRGKDSSGDILFEHEAGWADDPAGRSAWQVKQVGFFGLACVDEVYRQLNEIIRSAPVIIRRE